VSFQFRIIVPSLVFIGWIAAFIWVLGRLA